MRTISVATLNLRNSANQWLRRRELVVDQLIEADVDIIALQEIALPIGQGRWLRNQLNFRLSSQLTEEDHFSPYELVRKKRAHPFYSYIDGVGILSRLPILSSDGINLGRQGRVAIRANIELPSGETFDFVSLHLFPDPHAHQTREEQVMRMMGWLHGKGAVKHRVICGTFRAERDSLAVDRMKVFYGYSSAFEVAIGRELLATYPTPLTQTADEIGLCHDYIFLSPKIAGVDSAEIICQKPSDKDPRLYPSDHVGLKAILRIDNA